MEPKIRTSICFPRPSALVAVEWPEMEIVAPLEHCTAPASETSAPVTEERRMKAKAEAGFSLVTWKTQLMMWESWPQPKPLIPATPTGAVHVPRSVLENMPPIAQPMWHCTCSISPMAPLETSCTARWA